MITHIISHIKKEWAKRPTLLTSENPPQAKAQEFLATYDTREGTFVQIWPSDTRFDDGQGEWLLEPSIEVYKVFVVPQRRTHESTTFPGS